MKNQKDNHLDRIEKKIDAMDVKFNKKLDKMDVKFNKLAELVERGFGAVADDISHIKENMATKEHVIALGMQGSSIERELRDVKRTLFRIADKTDKHDGDIAEAFKRIAMIEKHIGLHTGK